MDLRIPTYVLHTRGNLTLTSPAERNACGEGNVSMQSMVVKQQEAPKRCMLSFAALAIGLRFKFRRKKRSGSEGEEKRGEMARAILHKGGIARACALRLVC